MATNSHDHHSIFSKPSLESLDTTSVELEVLGGATGPLGLTGALGVGTVGTKVVGESVGAFVELVGNSVSLHVGQKLRLGEEVGSGVSEGSELGAGVVEEGSALGAGVDAEGSTLGAGVVEEGSEMGAEVGLEPDVGWGALGAFGTPLGGMVGTRSDKSVPT